MRLISTVGAFGLTAATLVLACSNQEQSPELSGPYLGQTPPGDTVELFAPGIVSTDIDELNSIFTPDGMRFYFSTNEEDREVQIMEMIQSDDVWSTPRAVSFGHPAGDVDPFVSPDGNRLFFGSMRPRPGSDVPEESWQIWMVEWEGNDWGDPVFLSSEINSGPRQIYPAVTSEGTLYFQSQREGTLGGSDIFVSQLVDGEYTEAVNVGPPVSSEYDEGDVFVSPDESYLIFVSRDRPGGFGSGDLYITFRQEDGSWSEALNLGDSINTTNYDYCPVVSPDGRYFFYTYSGDVYWIDAGFIERMRATITSN